MIGRWLGTGACALMATAALAAPGASAEVEHWGSYAGSGTVTEPTPIPNLEEVVAVDAGNESSYALESNGTVWSFGENNRGQLGDGTREASLGEAVQVTFPPGVRIVSIGEAQDSGYAIDSTGQGWSWGLVGPALCLGLAPQGTLVPQKVPGITSAVAVQGAAKHVMWLLRDGTIRTCGTNENGQLGAGEGVQGSATPLTVLGLSGVVEISAGQKESCARTASGAVYDWGADYNGQIGNGRFEESVFEPFHVPLPGPASDVSCGGDLVENGHAVALVGTSVYGWGADETFQLGDGQRTDKASPTLATDLGGLTPTRVVASGAYTLALTASGDVYGWGSNAYKALNGSSERFSETPQLLDAGASEISGTAYNSLDR